MAEDLAELTLAGLHQALLVKLATLSGIDLQTPVLDLGCGSGAWLARLGRHGFTDLRGVDNGSMVPMEAGNGYICSQADLDNPDLGLGDAKFGLITAIEVLEHMENPGHLLGHVRRHLAADGYFLLTTPNVHSVRARVRFAVSGKARGFRSYQCSIRTHPYLSGVYYMPRSIAAALRSRDRPAMDLSAGRWIRFAACAPDGSRLIGRRVSESVSG